MHRFVTVVYLLVYIDLPQCWADPLTGNNASAEGGPHRTNSPSGVQPLRSPDSIIKNTNTQLNNALDICQKAVIYQDLIVDKQKKPNLCVVDNETALTKDGEYPKFTSPSRLIKNEFGAKINCYQLLRALCESIPLCHVQLLVFCTNMYSLDALRKWEKGMHVSLPGVVKWQLGCHID